MTKPETDMRAGFIHDLPDTLTRILNGSTVSIGSGRMQAQATPAGVMMSRELVAKIVELIRRAPAQRAPLSTEVDPELAKPENEEIERVAKALAADDAERAGEEDASWELLPKRWQDDYRATAEVAVKALRDPAQSPPDDRIRQALHEVVTNGSWIDHDEGDAWVISKEVYQEAYDADLFGAHPPNPVGADGSPAAVGVAKSLLGCDRTTVAGTHPPQAQEDRPEDRPDTNDIRWAVNVLLDKIAAKFEAHETWDIWKSQAADIVRGFKHANVAPPQASESGLETTKTLHQFASDYRDQEQIIGSLMAALKMIADDPHNPEFAGIADAAADEIDRLNAQVERLTDALSVFWRPIETAPRDGRRILTTGGGLEDTVEVASYNERVGCWDTENYTLDDRDDDAEGYNRPTRWMHLPAVTSTERER